MGHQDAFLRPRLSARYRFSQATLAGTRGNGRDAPKVAAPGLSNYRRNSTAGCTNRARGAVEGLPPQDSPHTFPQGFVFNPVLPL